MSSIHYWCSKFTSECVSPKLLECCDLELAVPGTYNPTSQTVSIQQVVPTLQVITSKQRPRKLRICGEWHSTRDTDNTRDTDMGGGFVL